MQVFTRSIGWGILKSLLTLDRSWMDWCTFMIGMWFTGNTDYYNQLFGILPYHKFCSWYPPQSHNSLSYCTADHTFRFLGEIFVICYVKLYYWVKSDYNDHLLQMIEPEHGEGLSFHNLNCLWIHFLLKLLFFSSISKGYKMR